MTEFKQIIGRGTRINEDYGKLYFTIMDFRGATALFADPEFDGDPVQIYEPGPDETPVPPDDGATGRRRRRTPTTTDGIDPATRSATRRRGRVIKYYVNDVAVRVATEQVQYLDADGKLITESLRDYSKKTLRRHLRLARPVPHRLERGRPEAGDPRRTGRARASSSTNWPSWSAATTTPFDLVCHVAFDQPAADAQGTGRTGEEARRLRQVRRARPAPCSMRCWRSTPTPASPASSRWTS